LLRGCGCLQIFARKSSVNHQDNLSLSPGSRGLLRASRNRREERSTMNVIKKFALVTAFMAGTSAVAFAQNATVGGGARSNTGSQVGAGSGGVSAGSNIGVGAGANVGVGGVGGTGVNTGAGVSGNSSIGIGAPGMGGSGHSGRARGGRTR
jgi:hypothetical protein